MDMQNYNPLFLTIFTTSTLFLSSFTATLPANKQYSPLPVPKNFTNFIPPQTISSSLPASRNPHHPIQLPPKSSPQPGHLLNIDSNLIKSAPSQLLLPPIVSSRPLRPHIPAIPVLHHSHQSVSNPSSSLSAASPKFVSSNVLLPIQRKMWITNRLQKLPNHFANMFRLRSKTANRREGLNLRQFYEQYERGKENAMALYRAIKDAEERRFLQDPSQMFAQKDGDQSSIPDAMMNSMDLMQDRQVKGAIGRILSNFIGDCAGVIISEFFRKIGEIAGELARFIVSHSAQHVLNKGSGLMSKSTGQVSDIISNVKDNIVLPKISIPKIFPDKKKARSTD